MILKKHYLNKYLLTDIVLYQLKFINKIVHKIMKSKLYKFISKF
jgi:hypothetical protein